jgi:heme O synthase-like polyprenyltransferase
VTNRFNRRHDEDADHVQKSTADEALIAQSHELQDIHHRGAFMTLTLPGLVVLIVIAAICGAVGKALAGGGQGGLIASIALGFIGALLGRAAARSG